jgi:SMC interacting uncharacterized protein involved in chromosome segregation
VVEARKLRAQTIIDEESLMSDADRANPDYFPKYLQVLQATEGKEEVWAGLSGKMVSEIMKVEDKMKENHEAMSAKHEQMAQAMSAKHDAMETRVSEVEAKLSAQMGELKAMMAELLAEGRR